MIILGCDHGGLELKEKIKNYLQKKNFDIVDVGAFELDKMDAFSDYVKKLKCAFYSNKEARLIAVCGSGVGMSIGLNRIKGVYCVLGYSVDEVALARQHNNVNALALGGRNISIQKAKKMVDAFLNTEHLGGKYTKRMLDLDNL